MIRSSLCSLVALLVVLGTAGPRAQAQDAKTGAQVTKVDGVLLMAAKSGEWQSVAAKTDAPLERRLVALFGAEFQAANGAAQMRLVADVGERGLFPVLESAVQIHASAAADLDVTVYHGIAVLTNLKKTGAAKVAVRVRDEEFIVTLADSKARVGIEVYGRRVPGPVHFKKGKDDGPVTSAVFFTLAGEAMIENQRHATRLQAPPGTAMLLWDSATRMSESHRFDKLPDSMKPFSAEERKTFETICGYTRPLADKPGDAPALLAKAVKSATPAERKTAVVAMGALDDLPGLLSALSNEKADVRATAVLVARHWLGRDASHAMRWYELLTKDQQYTPTQAKNMLYLLSGIEEEKRRLPSTYDLLIHGLNHGKMPLRELAHWHLVRLAPEGKGIAYDAAASEAQRASAIEEWRHLIPEGSLPRPPEKKKSVP
jgi:hypothetical protein